MNAVALLKKHFAASPMACEVVLEHSRLVAAKALRIASSLASPDIDPQFIEEAALLHDIGVCRTYAPEIRCFGNEPYIRHGILGREILEDEGLPVHALVCERHIGVGLTRDDIVLQKLPLPVREMVPVTMEERIVCLADLFFSKRPGSLDREKGVDEVKRGLLRFGADKVAIFEGWSRLISLSDSV